MKQITLPHLARLRKTSFCHTSWHHKKIKMKRTSEDYKFTMLQLSVLISIIKIFDVWFIKVLVSVWKENCCMRLPSQSPQQRGNESDAEGYCMFTTYMSLFMICHHYNVKLSKPWSTRHYHRKNFSYKHCSSKKQFCGIWT